MSLIYVVDGYNAIKRSGAFGGKTLKDTRHAFLAYLENRRPQGSLRNRLIVVFDGSADILSCRHDHTFEIIFTRGETADDAIRKIAQETSVPKTLIVVTDDKELARGVRSRGARIMDTRQFLKEKKAWPGVPCRHPESDVVPELNIVEREAITQEMEAIWLKKKSS